MYRRNREETKSDVQSGVQLAWYPEKLFAPNHVPPNKRKTRFARLDAIQKKTGDQVARRHRKLSAPNYTPPDRGETCLATAHVIQKWSLFS